MVTFSAARFTLNFATHAPVPTRFTLSTPRCVHSSRISRSSRSFAVAVASASPPSDKRRVVFLGTPQVAATTLQTLHAASQEPSSSFSITAVVTQPPAPVGRKRVLTKSPVHLVAEQLSISTILTPSKASDQEFLTSIENIEPHLCITAAYGQFLTSRFLRAPAHGTLNIHPSLLPQFRGAAPVPRALEAGVPETGVCVLTTVLKMDAGPIVARRVHPLTGDEQAPELLEHLFKLGTDALLDVLPQVWNDSAPAEIQDEELATHAPKLSKDEARITFVDNAQYVHNRVRAFAGWPGTWADFVVTSDKGPEEIRLKINKTKVLREQGGMCFGIHQVTFNDENECLDVTCGDGSKIGLLSVLPPGKKEMSARSFWNGLRGKTVHRKRLPY